MSDNISLEDQLNSVSHALLENVDNGLFNDAEVEKAEKLTNYQLWNNVDMDAIKRAKVYLRKHKIGCKSASVAISQCAHSFDIRELNNDHVKKLVANLTTSTEDTLRKFESSPFIVYYLDETFFVLDGNHRLAAIVEYNKLPGVEPINSIFVELILKTKPEKYQILWLTSLSEQRCRELKLDLTPEEAIAAVRVLVKSAEIPIPEIPLSRLKTDDVLPFVNYVGCKARLVKTWMMKLDVINDEDFLELLPKMKHYGWDGNFWMPVLNNWSNSPRTILPLLLNAETTVDSSARKELIKVIKAIPKDLETLVMAYFQDASRPFDEIIADIVTTDLEIPESAHAEELHKFFAKHSFNQNKSRHDGLSYDEKVKKLSTSFRTWYKNAQKRVKTDTSIPNVVPVNDDSSEICSHVTSSLACLVHSSNSILRNYYNVFKTNGNTRLASFTAFLAQSISGCKHTCNESYKEFLDKNGNFDVNCLLNNDNPDTKSGSGSSSSAKETSSESSSSSDETSSSEAENELEEVFAETSSKEMKNLSRKRVKPYESSSDSDAWSVDGLNLVQRRRKRVA